MGQPPRDYRYRLRKYPRRHGVVWRWFIFEGDSGPVETGIVLEPDRDKAEAAATIVIDSENIHAGTGLSGAGLFLKATAVR